VPSFDAVRTSGTLSPLTSAATTWVPRPEASSISLGINFALPGAALSRFFFVSQQVQACFGYFSRAHPLAEILVLHTLTVCRCINNARDNSIERYILLPVLFSQSLHKIYHAVFTE
jgi:hypothetical protein